MSEFLELQSINKQFGKQLAVNQVSLKIPENSIYGLLGPNGAGKTTLIRMITNIIGVDSGSILQDGKPFTSGHRELIGYLPEERGLYKRMKVGEQLIYLARLRGLSGKDAKARIKNWMDRFEMTDWWDKKIDELSKGMQQKVQFIATVVHEPKLLILDEPFSGLDPVNTNLIRNEINRLHEKGITIIFSTHRMEQVEEICSHICLINEGKNILEGTLHDIRDTYKENEFTIKSNNDLPNSWPEQFEQIDKETVRIKEGGDSTQLLKFLVDKNIQVNSFTERIPSLNEIFIKMVSKTPEA